MTDNHTKQQRSYNMSRIHSTHTQIELKLKKLLKGTYLRYQPEIYGNPDFGIKKYKIAVFVDGCFWHKCPECYTEPKSNRKFWIKKLNNNSRRDNIINKKLKQQDYTIIRCWEHQIKKDADLCSKKIISIVKKRWKK